MRRETLRHHLGITLTVLAVFFTSLGVPRLWDDDEPKNANCAREMFERGDWIVPTFNQELRYDKPALVYWLMIAAYHVFGVNEFAARLPSAMLAVVTTLATYHCGRLLLGARVGLWAALAISTSVLFVVAGRAATPDSALVCSTTVAMLVFVRAVFARSSDGTLVGPVGDACDSARVTADFAPRSLASWLAVYAAMGVGVLAKGPVAVVLPTAAIGAYLFFAQQCLLASADEMAGKWRRVARLFSPRVLCQVVWQMRPLTALAVVAAIALPWYIAVGLRTGGDWPAGFLGTHNVGRFLKPMEGHKGPIVYYIPAIALGFFPWSVFLPLGLWQLATKLRLVFTKMRPAWTAYLFLACWAGTYVAFFSFSGTKLPSYVLPAYPALALIVAAFIDRWLREPDTVHRWALCSALGAIAVAGLAFIVGFPLAARSVLPGEGALGLIGVALLAGGIASVWLAARSPRRAAWTFAGTAIVFVTTLFGIGAVHVSRHQNSASLVELARRGRTGPIELATFDLNTPSLVFYARQRVDGYFDPADVRRFFDRSTEPYLIACSEQLDRLRGVLGDDAAVVARQRRFLRRGDLVMLGRPPSTSRANRAEFER
jgi:4-amino-4-deoxy-L-arabinose transferase-like glycosyltransferase